jgi:murein L,D-transpeptidase YafK
MLLLAAPCGFAVEEVASKKSKTGDVPKPVPLGLTVQQAIDKYGPEAKKRLLLHFQSSKAAYPPDHLYLICLKSEGVLLVFAKDADSKMKQIASYAIVSNSGVSGPKLKEGDLQIPEGFYKISRLDAMTHLAMWVNYPNRIDRAHAQTDRRTNIGSNIQIHGGVYSTGCIVITNDDMAELLVVANDIGYKNVDLMISPCNLLDRKPQVDFRKQPNWLPGLYKEIKDELIRFPIAL